MIAPFPWPRTGPVRRRCKLNSCTFLGIFSQPAISTHKSGNSADISKRYFQNCTASSSPTWSASKSLISQR